MAAVLLMQQLLMAAGAQEETPGMDVGRVPGPHTKSGVMGTPASESRELGTQDSLRLSGTAATEPGRADGTGKPALGGERRPLYRLANSDVVEIDFTFSPEFNQTVSVQPDGYIRIKGLDDIYVQGRTLSELEGALRAKYKTTLHDPEVTVVLKEFDKPYFLAFGEVGRPGKYELRGETSLTQAVALAGGFTHSARHSEVLLFHRIGDGQVEARVLDVKKMLRGRELGEDPFLRPGDWLYVPQNTVSKIKPFLPVPTVGSSLNPPLL